MNWKFPAAFVLSIALSSGSAGAQEIRSTVIGGIAAPGTYALPAGSRLSSLIEKGGGFTKESFPSDALLVRNSLIAGRRTELASLIAKLEEEAAWIPAGHSKQAFFESLKKLEPAERMRLSLAHPRLLKGSAQDLVLEDGDKLAIPVSKSPVIVTGEVKDKNRREIPHSDRSGYKDYIRMAGGFSKNADTGHVYLLKAGAAAVPLSRKWINWNADRSRWEIGSFGHVAPVIDPGDTIVVPRKPSPGSWARNVKNLQDLLMRMTAITGKIVEAP